MYKLSRQDWKVLLNDLGSTFGSSIIPQSVQINWFEKLCGQYDQTWRRYHNAIHIIHLLNQFELRGKAVAKNPLAVLTAIWFHDAEMEPGLQTNEFWSAVMASEFCEQAGLSDVFMDTVITLILATTPNGVEHETPDERLIADINRSVLGGTSMQFCDMENQIQQEYVGSGFVTNEEHNRRHTVFLRKMLLWQRIYQTEIFYKEYEHQARENIRRFLNTFT